MVRWLKERRVAERWRDQDRIQGPALKKKVNDPMTVLMTVPMTVLMMVLMTVLMTVLMMVLMTVPPQGPAKKKKSHAWTMPWCRYLVMVPGDGTKKKKVCSMVAIPW